jgi:acyl-CoA thioesterase-1
MASAVPASETPRIVVLGDSLTAGYGLPPGEDFPAVLQEELREDGIDVVVENAGVSGDTTSGGLARLDWALGNDPEFVIVELGANDALRGIDPEITRRNLDTILARLKERGITVLLTGMRAPPNMGKEYTSAFDGLYAPLARKHDVLFYPFFLDGVAAEPTLNQPDGIHPNAEGVRVIVEKISPVVKKLLNGKQAA